MKKLVLGLLTISLLTLSTCSDNPVTDDFMPPGSRNIEWFVDTINTQRPLALTRIWGNLPDNVWAIGYGASTLYLIWQYNGLEWSTDSIPRIIEPSSIYGFSRNNIWMGNGNNTIWHYNRLDWNLHSTFSLAGFDQIVFENIWGESPQNIYAVGFADQFNGTEYTGVIAHYNGTTWKLINLPPLRISFIDIRKQESSGLYFLEATNFEVSSGFTSKLYTFNGSVLNEIYSDPELATLNEVNGEIYFVIRPKIYKYLSNALVLWKDFSGTNFLGRMWGRSEKDFYCINQDGIGHYNGTDLLTLYKIDAYIANACVLESDCFFLIEDNNSIDINIRGKIIK